MADEVKVVARNFERLVEKKFRTYEAAKAAQANSDTGRPGMKYDKSKVFARNDNTFDVVWYKKIGIVSKDQVAESIEKVKVVDTIISVSKVKNKDNKKAYKAKKFAQ